MARSRSPCARIGVCKRPITGSGSRKRSWCGKAFRPIPTFPSEGSRARCRRKSRAPVAADILALATLPARGRHRRRPLRGGATGGGRSDVERRDGGAPGVLPGCRRARTGPCHGTGGSGGRDRGETLPPTRRNRRDAQARSGPRPAFPCRDRRQARERPPKRVQRARAACPRAGPLGSRSSCVLPDALPIPPAHSRDMPKVEHEAVERRIDLQIARKKLAALAEVPRTREVDALRRSFPAIGARFDHAGKRQWRQGSRSTPPAPAGRSKFRSSTLAKRASANRSSAGSRRQIFWPRRPSRFDRRRAKPISPIARLTRSPASSARNHAVARHHQRRNPAALQHDDRRRVRPARGRAAPRRRDGRGGRGQAGFLARRRRSARSRRGRRRGALKRTTGLHPRSIAETGAERP